MSSGSDSRDPSRGPGPTGGATAATPVYAGYYAPSGEPDVPVVPPHLYIHVPLCRAKCAYCDFCSFVPDEAGLRAEEVALHLLRQAEAWADRGVPSQPLRSLYIGGGTPTILGGALPFLVESIRRTFGFRLGAEVTVEANPDSVDDALLGMLARAGVTRVSLGVQSLDDGELRALGRVHDAGSALRAARSVVRAGMDLSVDLMCGIPGQTGESWEATLCAAVGTGCNHVSVYPLSLEDGTPLAAAVGAGEVTVPDDDSAADMMEHASATLAAAGLRRYEVANFARPGHESVHNSAYWTGAEYLGVGPSAHGMFTVRTAEALGLGALSPLTARVRYAVTDEPGEGLEQAPPLEVECLTLAEAHREDAMLGMRTSAGIAAGLAESAGIGMVLEELREAGLVIDEDGRWRTSERGWLLGNEVFRRVWIG